MKPLWQRLLDSADATLAATAAKAFKEVSYHLRHTSEWVIRLGDGTEESHQRMVDALDDLVMFTGELFEMDAVATEMAEQDVGVDAAVLADEWRMTVDAVIAEATLKMPEVADMQTGGRKGVHTEHFGHIMSEMQYMQRTFPGMTW